MPQALKISIPGIVSTFIGLFKDTTLVSIIGLLDPIGLSNAIRADADWNGIVWELYGFIALLFFIFCFGMSRYSMWLERKLQTGHNEERPPMSELAIDREIDRSKMQVSDEVAVEINGMNKWFGAFHVLRDINLTVHEGERIVIAGRRARASRR